MIKNYIRIAFRNLQLRPGISSINILGLAMGMACCLLIGLFVLHERSFDQMHSQGDRIYRLNKRVTPQGASEEFHAITGGLMGPEIAAQFPEVEQSVRVLPWFDDVLMHQDEKAIKVSDVLLADANFLTVFDFELVRGSAGRALLDPFSIVLSETTAQRLFGSADPMGEAVVGLNGRIYNVTGIIEDSPSQSHLKYNALISFASTVAGEETLNFSWLHRWTTQVVYTYLVLTPGADVQALEEKFIPLMDQNLPQQANTYHLYLQPLKDIYLGSSNLLHTRGLVLGNGSYVMWFTIIGFLVLIIACINYMNLATARYTRRMKEVGVRKALGAQKKHLSNQFLVESMMLSGFALAIALIVAKGFLPAFNAITNRALELNMFQTPGLILSAIALALVTGAIAGSYPAVFLSGIRPVKALKKVQGRVQRGASIRRALVVTQFAASIALIICTSVIMLQMRFMQHQNPGFERDQILVLPIGLADIGNQFEPFKEAILKHPNITHAAGSNSVPGTREGMMSFSLVAEGKAEDENWSSYAWRVDDFDLLDTYGIGMASGRYFSERFPTDATSGVVINETLAEKLGWEEPVGKQLDISGETENARVIGVLKDFHFESFHHPIESLVLYMAPRYEMISVRVEGGNMAEVLSFLEGQWKQFDETYPFEYTFLDEAASVRYQTERQLMQTLLLFSVLAIFIACMGLFGLAAFSAQQRTKEIGIRKAVGASVSSLVGLLSSDFVMLVGIAFLVSTPLSYISVSRWLEGFAFRIEVPWWVFLAAGILALTVTLVTVSYHSIKLAIANPVKALRYE